MNDSIPPQVQAYAEAFAALTEDTLDDLLELVSDDIVFTDPFNKVFDKDGFEAIFRHMFVACDEPSFIIADLAAGSNAYYLRWRMTGRIRGWPNTPLNFEGMSEIRLDENGLVSHHLDHWDSASQLLATLPVIGALLRPVMRRFQVGR